MLPRILLAPVLLMVVAVYAGVIVWRGRAFRPRLMRTLQESSRAQVLTRWGWGQVVSFGIPATIGLLMLGIDPHAPGLPSAIAVVPEEWVGWPPMPFLAGMAIGTVVSALLTLWRARRGRAPFRIGDFPDVLPRRRGDIVPAIWLSISAGVCEELFFRLLVPLLVGLVFGSAWAAVIVGTLLFGAVHRYQGPRGVIATTLVGGALSLLFAASGAFWLAVAFHIVIDLNALVVRPLCSGDWIRSSAASPS